MQLLLIGNNIVNLDRVSVIDIDPAPVPNSFVVHIHSDSNTPVMDIIVPGLTVQGLVNLVPLQQRFAGND